MGGRDREGDTGEVAVIVNWLERSAVMLCEMFEPKPKRFFLVEICVLRIVPHCENGTCQQIS
jgi:hypothetical protein